MGINVKGGNVVMHLGPSSGVDDYLQESGRVGRNNESAHAILLRYKGCTRSRNITKEMKQYTKNETVCRRTLLLKSFTVSPTQSKILHTCCDICADQCKCLIVPVVAKNVYVKKSATKVITSQALKNY